MNTNSTTPHKYVNGSYTGGCLVCDRPITHRLHAPQTTLTDDPPDETCAECGRVDHPAYMCWRVGHLPKKETP